MVIANTRQNPALRSQHADHRKLLTTLIERPGAVCTCPLYGIHAPLGIHGDRAPAMRVRQVDVLLVGDVELPDRVALLLSEKRVQITDMRDTPSDPQ